MREEDGIVNNLMMFLDMMTGLKDLFERRAKGIVADMTNINKKLARNKKKKKKKKKKKGKSEEKKVSSRREKK